MYKRSIKSQSSGLTATRKGKRFMLNASKHEQRENRKDITDRRPTRAIIPITFIFFFYRTCAVDQQTFVSLYFPALFILYIFVIWYTNFNQNNMYHFCLLRGTFVLVPGQSDLLVI
jgi:hypothetical protein